MNPNRANELLDHAAASVTPSETDPAARLLTLGRRSMRRRRAWTAAGSIAAVVAVVVAVPMAITDLTQPEPAGTVTFGGLTVAVPEGWRTSEVETVDVCTAEPRTVYLAQASQTSAPLTQAPGTTPHRCESEGQPFIVLTRSGPPRYVSPDRLISKDEGLLQASEAIKPTGWSYRAFNDEMRATGVYISGGGPADGELLRHITWPAGPPAPASGGLALPETVTSAVTEDAGPMVNAMDAETLGKIRSKLAALREPVPADEVCTLQEPGRVGISLNAVTVVLGDATCPQAVSTGGGRVRAPAGLGRELHALIVASERAAVQRKLKD